MLTCFHPHWGQWHNRRILQKSHRCALEFCVSELYPNLITNSFYIKMLMSVQSCNSPMWFWRTHFSILSPEPGNCSYGICVLQTVALLTPIHFLFLNYLALFSKVGKSVQIPNYMHLDFHNWRNVTFHPLWWGLVCTSPLAFLLDLQNDSRCDGKFGSFDSCYYSICFLNRSHLCVCISFPSGDLIYICSKSCESGI